MRNRLFAVLAVAASSAAALAVVACSDSDSTPTASANPPGWYSGTLRTANGDEPIRYELENGQPRIEGDILLKRIDVQPENSGGTSAQSFTMGSQSALLAAGDLWPNNTIPYRFDPSVPANEQTTVLSAIKDWETNSALTFTFDSSNSASDYLLFSSASTNDYCETNLGHMAGANVVSIPSASCNQVNLIAHEIGHTVGLRHEMSRPDRDNYVSINWSNIQAGKQDQFEKQTGVAVGSFDFTSVMMYPWKTGSTGIAINVNQPIITLLDGGPYTIAPANQGLSQGDIAGVATLYPFFVKPQYPALGLAADTSDFLITFTTDLSQWPDQNTQPYVFLSGLPTGVITTTGGDVNGLHQYISVLDNAVLGTSIITVYAVQGTGATAVTHSAHFSLTVTARTKPKTPNAPNCTLASTCDSQYVPASGGVSAHYQTVETITGTCQTAPSTVRQHVDLGWNNLGGFASSLSYPTATTADKFEIGVQSSTGQTTSGAAVGSVQEVAACDTVGGVTACDDPSTVTIADCCQPLTCADTCGTVSDGCGGTLNCPACTCDAACQCSEKGGTWNGSTCFLCKTPACKCTESGGSWNGHTCL